MVNLFGVVPVRNHVTVHVTNLFVLILFIKKKFHHLQNSFLWHNVICDEKLISYNNPDPKHLGQIQVRQHLQNQKSISMAKMFFFAYGGITMELFIMSYLNMEKLSTLNITVIS